MKFLTSTARTGLFTGTALACLLYQPGCGTWIGNPKSKDPPASTTTPSTASGSVSLAITGSGTSVQLSAGTVPIIGKTGLTVGLFQITSAKISLKEIQFKIAEGDAIQHDSFDGPFEIDLLTNTSIPAIAGIKLAPGTYKDIELKTHKLEIGDIAEVDVNDSLLSNSVYIKGLFSPANGGSSTNVTIKIDAGESFSLFKSSSTKPGVVVTDNGSLNVIIAFRMNDWFNFQGQARDFSRA